MRDPSCFVKYGGATLPYMPADCKLDCMSSVLPSNKGAQLDAKSLIY